MLTIYCLLFTIYCLLFTAHCSLLTAHCSLLTVYEQEVRSLVKVGQEAFLTQLLEIGYFHGVCVFVCVYVCRTETHEHALLQA